MKSPIFVGLFFIFISCDNDSEKAATGSSEDLPKIFTKFSSNVTIYTQGDNIVLETDDIPDHNSPYFDGNRNEPYNSPSFNINPNRITEQSITIKIPVNPIKATSHSNTRLGPIGISINGVVLYNQYAGPNNQPLTNEIASFDQYNGHPQNFGQYHYHFEPLYITAEHGKDALIGFLLDGFPVYGPEENGVLISGNSLDQYHGHTTATIDYPNGIYHYHITADDPYINGGQYYGNVGSVTQ